MSSGYHTRQHRYRTVMSKPSNDNGNSSKIPALSPACCGVLGWRFHDSRKNRIVPEWNFMRNVMLSVSEQQLAAHTLPCFHSLYWSRDLYQKMHKVYEDTQTLNDISQKQDLYICCLQETNFRPRDTYRLTVRGWKKIFHANGNQRKAEVSMLISDKID